MKNVFNFITKNNRKINIVQCGYLGNMGRIYNQILKDNSYTISQFAIIQKQFDHKLTSQFKTQQNIPDFNAPHFVSSQQVDSFLQKHHEQIDGFLICSPSYTHVPYIKKFAPYRKPIMTEKPLSLNRQGARQAFQACQKSGAKLSVAMTRRFDPGFSDMKAKYDRGDIGRLQSIICRFGDYPGPHIDFLKTCGGLIADCGIHDIDFARYIKGQLPKRVYSILSRQSKEYIQAQVDDYNLNQYEFNDGSVAIQEVRRFFSGGYDIRGEILGSKGSIQLQQSSETNILTSNQLGNYRTQIFPSYPVRFYKAYSNAFQELIDLIVDQNAKPKVTEKDALDGLLMIEAAELSAKERRVVELDEIA